MFADYFGTCTLPFETGFVHKFTKLTAEQIHAQYAVVVGLFVYFEDFVVYCFVVVVVVGSYVVVFNNIVTNRCFDLFFWNTHKHTSCGELF